MIVSASRRTDIPAYYAQWFYHRLREGYCLTRNPMNPSQVRRVDLREAEAFVFWTKNPLPMIDRLGELGERPYYFQWTMTSYGKDLEPGVPEKGRILIPALQEISRRIGKERIVWRYDPILISEKYDPAHHLRYFERMADRLQGYVDGCVISFLDEYARIRPAMQKMGFRPPNDEEVQQIAQAFSRICGDRGMEIRTCSEAVDLSRYGIDHGACIDAERLMRLGLEREIRRDRNQRPHCLCAASVDIGSYHSCPNGCLYCYANAGEAAVRRNFSAHDPKGEFLM